MSNTFDKLSVLDSFIEEVNSYLPGIEANLGRLAQSHGDMDALEETYRLTHTIGGSASMMDFPGLAHVAHGMEDVLGDALDGLIPLDDPAFGLLQRSLGRLRQLLEGIRSGIDEEAVIAEDDADYTNYRALIEPSASQGTEVPEVASEQPSFTVDGSSYVQPSPMPSFDEVLASFRTPAVTPGEDVAWPEEPAQEQVAPESPSQTMPPTSSPTYEQEAPFEPPMLSALDTLVASMRQPSSPPYEPPAAPSAPLTPSFPAASPIAFNEDVPVEAVERSLAVPDSAQQPSFLAEQGQFPQLYNAMQSDAQNLDSQASSLKNVLAQLRDAAVVIEEQRKEFNGFLNGSKDALDRMEAWAGQAMGLNLRNSPEQVRRYLPLSVMWVSNSKLKRVLGLLQQITGGVEMTDEQLGAALQQLHSSIQSCGEAFQQMQAQSSVSPQEDGWSPWEVRVTHDTDRVRERVTFEREGDLALLRAEMEAKLREEISREYEASQPSPSARLELEQQIRNEVRQEFEERQRLQARAYGTETNSDTALRELEAHLRNDIEIQVRQEFLSQLSAMGTDPTSIFHTQPATPTQAGDAPEQPHLSTTLPPLATPRPAPPPVTPPAQKPLSNASSSAYSGDIGEEAAEVFRLEAEEHLQTISMHVAALEKDPTNLDLTQGIRRATHTLKGAAAMMGFRAIADLCHISEDLLDSIMEGTTPISSPVLSIVLDTAEVLDILITGNHNDPTGDDARVREMQIRYAELLGEEHSSELATHDEVVNDHVEEAARAVVMASDEQSSDTIATRSARNDLSVRVRLQKLDELVNLFGELLVNRSVLEERIQRLVRLVADVTVSSNRLADVGQKLESRFEAATLPSGRSVQVMPGEGTQSLTSPLANGRAVSGNLTNLQSHLSEFDELELDRYTEFHQLARGLSEGISDMATLSTEMDTIIRECEGVFSRENRLNTTFQDRLMKARLVPLSSMVPRLYRTARAVALKQGKDFEFLLEGEETEVDRTVYEEIFGPLLHLIRNAVNHAIEKPEARAQRGKPPTGQIKLSAAYEGNQIVITVRDDGTGIEHEQVRRAAIARGLIRPDHPALNESDLVTLIFHPGFSTAEVLSEESGRGVGLDVVRDSVSRLRGTLSVESTPGQGTAFTMTFPTSLAIQSVMMVRAGGQQFAMPTVHVEAIGRLDNYKRATLGGQPSIVVRNELYPLQVLAQYLSLPENPIEEKAQLLLVNAGGQHVALVVDEIVGKSDIVMKNLGPHLRDVHGIAGATVLGNGHVVLVLEMNSLISVRAAIPTPSAVSARRDAANAANAVRQRIDVPASRQSAAALGAATPATPASERGKHILVVDDSPSVRRVVSNMLKQHGWEVQMARDGVEALEMISAQTPAAVLLDIEMPRMDGYELTSTVRAQEQYRTLPLIVLTSRAAAKHQQRAMSLGANAYVVKPYQDEELLNTINALVYGAIAR